MRASKNRHRGDNPQENIKATLNGHGKKQVKSDGRVSLKGRELELNQPKVVAKRGWEIFLAKTVQSLLQTHTIAETGHAVTGVRGEGRVLKPLEIPPPST